MFCNNGCEQSKPIRNHNRLGKQGVHHDPLMINYLSQRRTVRPDRISVNSPLVSISVSSPDPTTINRNIKNPPHHDHLTR